jgi:hypothetical protein
MTWKSSKWDEQYGFCASQCNYEINICPLVYLLWPLYCLFFFGILKLFICFHVPFHTKPEKKTGSKMSSRVTFDPEDLRTLVFVCLYTYEFWLSLCKIVRSSVILLLPLFTICPCISAYIIYVSTFFPVDTQFIIVH